MATSFLSTVAVTINVSLVAFVANLLTLDTVTSSAHCVGVAGNENGFASAFKVAA